VTEVSYRGGWNGEGLPDSVRIRMEAADELCSPP
jgi:hypothetical protein